MEDEMVSSPGGMSGTFVRNLSSSTLESNEGKDGDEIDDERDRRVSDLEWNELGPHDADESTRVLAAKLLRLKMEQRQAQEEVRRLSLDSPQKSSRISSCDSSPPSSVPSTPTEERFLASHPDSPQTPGGHLMHVPESGDSFEHSFEDSRGWQPAKRRGKAKQRSSSFSNIELFLQEAQEKASAYASSTASDSKFKAVAPNQGIKVSWDARRTGLLPSGRTTVEDVSRATGGKSVRAAMDLLGRGGSKKPTERTDDVGVAKGGGSKKPTERTDAMGVSKGGSAGGKVEGGMKRVDSKNQLSKHMVNKTARKESHVKKIHFEAGVDLVSHIPVSSAVDVHCVQLTAEQRQARRDKIREAMGVSIGMPAAKKGGGRSRWNQALPQRGSERIIFSTEEFWYELRAKVLFREGPNEERLSVKALRGKVPEVISMVKLFKFDPAISPRQLFGHLGNGLLESVCSHEDVKEDHLVISLDQLLRVLKDDRPRGRSDSDDEEDRVDKLVHSLNKRLDFLRRQVNVAQGYGDKLERLVLAVLAVGHALKQVQEVEDSYPYVYSRLSNYKLPSGKCIPSKSLACDHGEYSSGIGDEPSIFEIRLAALRSWYDNALRLLKELLDLQQLNSQNRWDTQDLGGLLQKVELEDVASLLLMRVQKILYLSRQLYSNDSQGRCFADHLEAMGLPLLSGSNSVGCAVAAIPCIILDRIIATHARESIRGGMASARSKRFDDAMQLLVAANDYRTELEEHLVSLTRGSWEHEVAGWGMSKKPSPIFTKLGHLLLVCLKSCKASNLDLASASSHLHSLGGAEVLSLIGNRAMGLRKACMVFRREEIPAILSELTPLHCPKTELVIAERHCGLAISLVDASRELLKKAGEVKSGRAAMLRYAVEACKAALSVSRQCVSMTSIAKEYKVVDAQLLVERLEYRGYIRIRAGECEKDGVHVYASSGALPSYRENGDGGDCDEEDAEWMGHMLGTTYGVVSGSSHLREVGGHVLRVALPSGVKFGGDEEARMDEQHSGSSSAGGGLVCNICGLENTHKMEENQLVLIASHSYLMQSEGRLFEASVNFGDEKSVDPIGSAARGMGRFRPNHSEMINHVMKVRKAWERLASDSARLVRDVSQDREMGGDYKFVSLPSVVTWFTPRAVSRGGAVRSTPLEHLFDLLANVTILADKPAEWDIATSLQNLLLAAGRGRYISFESITYFEMALRDQCGYLRQSDWNSWLKRLEQSFKASQVRKGGGSQISSMKLLKSSSTGATLIESDVGLSCRARRQAACRALEERLLAMRSSCGRAGRNVTESSMGEEEEEVYLQDSHGRRMHWIRDQMNVGRGTFGQVFRVQFWLTMHFAAVKTIEVSSMQELDRQSRIEKVKKEMEMMKRLDHKNIVRFVGYEVHSSVWHLFMEFCPEGTLRSLIDSWKEASAQPPTQSIVHEDVVRLFGRQLASALSHMHDRNVVHLDIKCINILVADRGMAVKLIDFGEAIETPLVIKNLKKKNSAPGTLGHMAPEIFRAHFKNEGEESYGAPADIWSLGCVLYEMMSGQKPEDVALQLVDKADDIALVMFWLARKIRSSPSIVQMPFREFSSSIICDQAKFALEGCFDTDQGSRFTADQLLKSALLKPLQKQRRWNTVVH